MRNLITLNPEIRDTIIESGGDDAIKCYQCGRCMAACPWNFLKKIDYTTYRICQRIRLGAIIESEDKEDIAADTIDVFRCVGCDSCQFECPRGVNLSDVLRAIRRILVDYGSYPGELKSVVSRLYNSGNPFGEPAEKRADWAAGLDIPQFNESCEYLYFPCCVPAYDTRAKNVAQATAKILKMAGVSFGIIGKDEFCCGEAVRRVGAEKVFQTAVKHNTEVFTKIGVEKVITTPPHCYATFKNDYPEHYDKLDAIHVTQLFAQLIKEKKIVPKKPFNKTVVYHDPCTLGRQMKILEEPREVLKSIPGLKLVEIPTFNREYSVCCGAGAMGLWRDWPQGERLTNFRVEQILNTNAELLAVACPYCLQMFEETIKSMNLDLQVMDIAEILFESLD
ncbi:4Fe-4S dicluster domain-containing protein [candidate division WOR-3 bacterium]|nr:4Fe-4S dicluster domain-containing protein [candidate division WOR-3 bacterium]